MGGAFDSEVGHGAACYFGAYVVDQSFVAQHAGFRCCFDSDPRL